VSLPSGLDAQFGVAEESSYGTIETPTRFYEFVSESIKRNGERIESAGLRPNRRVQSVNGWAQGRVGVEGDVELEHPDRGGALLWKHILGAVNTTQPDVGNAPTVYEHTATLGNLGGKSLTGQVGRPDVGGVVRPFTYSGLKVAEWELSIEVDGTLMLTLTFDGHDEDTDTEGLAVTSYPTGVKPLYFTGATINLAGAQYDVSEFSLSGSNGLKTDRYFLRGSGTDLKKEPLESEKREYTGELLAEFDGLTAYNRFVNGTTAALTATFEGDTIEDAFKFAVEVNLAVVRFDGETPSVEGAEVLEQPLAYKVLDNGTDSPVEVVVRDNSATP
jgi:hypothetical protein